MSLYVAWVNLIKEKADESWLTDSQRLVYDAFLERWLAQPFVNLHGQRGSGKSFIARTLVKRNGYAYVQDLALAPPHAPNVVLDDAEYSRALRPLARNLGLGRVLLITESALRESIPKVELVLTSHDIHQFCAVLSKHCGIALTHTLPEGLDLGEILRRETIARGRTHVSE